MLDSNETPSGWDDEKGGWESDFLLNLQKQDEYMARNMQRYDNSRKSLKLGDFDCLEAAKVYIQMICDGNYTPQERRDIFENLSQKISRKIIDDVIERDMEEVN